LLPINPLNPFDQRRRARANPVGNSSGSIYVPFNMFSTNIS
jgi:hypothetical protein